MFLQITTTHKPATDLGYLLGKHPDRVQDKELAFGRAHVFFPEASDERCSAVLMLEIDTIALARSRSKQYSDSFQLGQYVNDRPYAASSFMSTAIAKVFGSALNGNCSARPELVDQPLSFEVKIAALPAKGGENTIREFFEPLGYQVQTTAQILDAKFPNWGQSMYFEIQLNHTLPLRTLLRHLYILIPALDNKKHYYVGADEVDKLIAKAKSWLEGHPAMAQITRRYLKHRSSLALQAIEQLRQQEDEEANAPEQEPEEQMENKISLHDQRHQEVIEALKEREVQTVLDLGCSTGKLLKKLLRESQFQKITGMDVSFRALEVAKRRLNWDTMTPRTKERIQLLHGALTYRDRRLEGYDAAVAVEVIEHLDENRLRAFEQAIFQYARPKVVVVTTPNVEYNVLFENMEPGTFRHSDHRFEWTREEFRDWATKVSKDHQYQVSLAGIGAEDETHGCPSQMAVFFSVFSHKSGYAGTEKNELSQSGCFQFCTALTNHKTKK
ncbi:MAG: 3' terminal RNA ribose 2'-O-methyltransferase Hen1 [Saprospiraceae bacterium]|nr:3' terminal RNA ribose 2'-O-methyltransferase Hen1 [Lewinella sp.]